MSVWQNLNEFLSRYGLGAKIGCIAGFIIAAPFAIYIGIVVGGNFGGAIGWQLLKGLGVWLGIIIGFTITAGIVLIVGALLGGCLGYAVAYIFRLISSG